MDTNCQTTLSSLRDYALDLAEALEYEPKNTTKIEGYIDIPGTVRTIRNMTEGLALSLGEC